MFSRLLLVVLLLSLAVGADTVRLQGVSVPVQKVEGRQVIARPDATQAFPNLPEDIEYVELERLVSHPSARITRRDGKVTAIRFYSNQMGEMWDSQKKDTLKRPENEQASSPSGSSRPEELENEDKPKRSLISPGKADRVRFTPKSSRGHNRVEMLRDTVDRRRDY